MLLVLGPLYVAASGGLGSFDAWQLAALILSAFLATAWLILTVRFRTPRTLVLASLPFLPAAVGFATYVASPGPAPQDNVVLALGVVAYAVVLVLTVVAIARRMRAKPAVLTLAAVDRGVARTLLARLLATAWLTALLFTFEPGFALASLVLNAVWEAVWIPRRWRTTVLEYVSDIAADPRLVFDFISDPDNWSQYRDDGQVIDVQPPGRLRTGTRYVVRRQLPAARRGGKERNLEIPYVVSEVIPGESYSVTLPDRKGNLATTVVGRTPEGTRITFRSRILVSFALASQAGVLGIAAEKAALSTSHAKRTAALKRLLETAPRQ